MASGKRIRYFRKSHGITQRELGMACGFPETNADVRIGQYENAKRTPREDVVRKMAEYLKVSPRALMVPEMDDYVGLMHILFAMEDMYGFRVTEAEGDVCLRIDPKANKDAERIHELMGLWLRMSAEYRNWHIEKLDYDGWRHQFPNYKPAE